MEKTGASDKENQPVRHITAGRTRPPTVDERKTVASQGTPATA
jgi:hypothetical protein